MGVGGKYWDGKELGECGYCWGEGEGGEWVGEGSVDEGEDKVGVWCE